MSIGAEPLGVAPRPRGGPRTCRGCRRPARGRSARARRPRPCVRRGRVAERPDGSPTCAVKSPRISTATCPRSWNSRSRRSTTAKPRWMSEAVGSMPSFTRSGRPDSSLARSSCSEMTSTAPPRQELHLAVDAPPVASVLIAPSAPRRWPSARGSAPSARCSRRATVTPDPPASRHDFEPRSTVTPCVPIGSRSTVVTPAVTRRLPLGKGIDLIGDDEIDAVTAVLRDRSPLPLPLAAHAAHGSTRSRRPCAPRSGAGTRWRCRAAPPRCASRSRRSVCGRATRSSCLRSRSSRR